MPNYMYLDRSHLTVHGGRTRHKALIVHTKRNMLTLFGDLKSQWQPANPSEKYHSGPGRNQDCCWWECIDSLGGQSQATRRSF